ncbi:hypothetical protein TRAPUB_3754 [Trametes pubescens]|uniref:Uncharacterized protein n=1 Tax=Trametes pubescens TaxID=154538 RepID=A0A1M2VD15_TRAPU|nr:hypothetical protein TRAPUB_3754 [Trametes pubescens]
MSGTPPEPDALSRRGDVHTRAVRKLHRGSGFGQKELKIATNQGAFLARRQL